MICTYWESKAVVTVQVLRGKGAEVEAEAGGHVIAASQ